MISSFTPNFIDFLLVVTIGIVIPLRSIKAQKKMKSMQFDTALKKQLYIGNSLGLFGLAAILAAVNWLMGRTPISFGLHWPPPNLSASAIYTLLIFILLYGLDLAHEISTPENREKTIQHWKENIPFLPSNRIEFQYFIILALSAGIFEEFIFRGYFISYFYNLLGEQYVYAAILIPTLIFALVHQYQGKKAIVKIFFLATFFGLLYYYTASLWLVMFLHFCVDLLGGFVAWKLLAPQE